MTVDLIYQLVNGGIAIAVMLGGIMLFITYARWKNGKEVQGKILSYFATPGGRFFYALCEEQDGKVIPPEGIEGEYFVTADTRVMGKWKPGQASIFQVGVPVTFYMEGDPAPRITVSKDKWIDDPKKKKDVSSFMIRKAVNESFAKTVVAMQSAAWKDIATMTQFIKNVPMMFYISLGVLACSIGTLYMVYMMFNQVAQLSSAFGVK